MAAWVFFIDVLHNGVSRAEFSLTEPIFKLFILTTTEIQDYCMARLGHKYMAVDSKSSSALDVDFIYEDFHPVVLCKHHP